MTMTPVVQCSGYDTNGIRRVFGLGETRNVAETECKRAILEYIRERPDTGPAAQWSVTFNVPRK